MSKKKNRPGKGRHGGQRQKRQESPNRHEEKLENQNRVTLVKGAFNKVTFWDRSVEYHKCLAEWYYFAPWEGITLGDLMDFAMYGDLVAQAYLYALGKAIPSAGDTRAPSNYFERLLLAHARRLNELVCELARAGRWAACMELWDQALTLSETFSELALQNPAPFKTKARQSLFMPSVRAKNPDFTADAEAIAEAIELSAETVGDKLTDNRVRLGALCARLVAECGKPEHLEAQVSGLR